MDKPLNMFCRPWYFWLSHQAGQMILAKSFQHLFVCNTGPSNLLSLPRHFMIRCSKAKFHLLHVCWILKGPNISRKTCSGDNKLSLHKGVIELLKTLRCSLSKYWKQQVSQHTILVSLQEEETELSTHHWKPKEKPFITMFKKDLKTHYCFYTGIAIASLPTRKPS